MNKIKTKFPYFLVVLLAMMGIYHFVLNSEILLKKSSNITSYIAFDGNYLEISPISHQLSIPVNQVHWSTLNAPSAPIIDNLSKPEATIKRLDVFVENRDNYGVFSTSIIDSDFWESIYSKFGQSATLYLKITNAANKQYASIVSSSSQQRIYSENLMVSNFFDFQSLSIANGDAQSKFEKEFSLLSLQSVDKNGSVPVIYISNETIQENIECSINLETRSQDSLHVLIKSGHGNIRKMCFSPEENVDIKALLTQHVEETTIYFCDGSPQSMDRKLGILVISDYNKMLAVQPRLIRKLVGISLNQVQCRNLYFNPANIDFVWGDIQLRLTKNKAGNYHAKKRIAKSKWESSMQSLPNLMLGNSLNMDSLSFDFSIANQHKDTVNEVRVENVDSAILGETIQLNMSDTLSSGVKSKSIIRFDDIQNEDMDNAKISLEFEIYDDSPKAKEKKYQIHWGTIDTTLTQKEEKRFFTESLAMSIGEFRQLLLKEPVLTSSLKGVLDAFDFELAHIRAGKKLQIQSVETNIKKSKVFLNSMEDFKLKNEIEVGDTFVLENFSGEELPKQESLYLEILINNDKLEEESIDESNVFLTWGGSILKTIPLLDNSRKKKVQDQIIDRQTLLDIIKQPTILNRFGNKEAIVSAEWFINEDIYTKQKCNEEWKDCFMKYIDHARAGDFVSLFLRTKKGNGAICQFYLDRVKEEDIIGFGNTEFDSLLFKYAKQVYQSDTSPKYDYNFVWGEEEFTLELKGNPRVFGGQFKINQRVLEDLFDEKISIISSDGEVISIKHAYLYLKNIKLRNEKFTGKWTSYDFDCKNLDCKLNFADAKKLLEIFEHEVYSLRVFIDQHEQSEEFVKVSFIDFIIENESHAWLPKEWVTSNVDTDIFEFQFVYQEKEKTLVKLDKQNEKYKWIVDKYENDPAVDILNIPSFKTIQRAIYTKNDKGANKGIRTTEVLSKDYTNAYTLNDYHKLQEAKPKLFWKGYQSLYGGQTYCKDDFICADGELTLQIGDDVIPILRGDLIILPEDGPGYKFIFDDIDSMEIISILKDIPPKTNLFFENIIIPDDTGARVRLPLKFAYHLE